MNTRILLSGVTAASMAVVGACAEPRALTAPADEPSFHVGYKGADVPLGFVENNAECHIGKKGDRWPAGEQYEVKVYDAELVTTPSGVMVLVCSGDIPADQPRPTHAVVEANVLCFLPNQVSTRDASEIFTPGGRIILRCQYNPRR
jgi:hypothetical protein